MSMASTLGRGRGGRRVLVPALVVIVVLVLIGYGTSLWTNLLWFDAVGYGQVFTHVLLTRVGMFFGFGIAMALIVGVNLVIAYLLRPGVRSMSLEQQNLERYRTAIGPHRRLLVGAVCTLLGILGGVSAQGRWRTWLLWRHGTTFGQSDAQFHRDLSYYVFTYPMQRYFLGFAFTAVILSVLGAVAVHYLYAAIRLQTNHPSERITAAARAHLSVLLGIFVLLKAFAYYLDRYGLVFSDRSSAGVGSSSVTGASYTDITAVLPAKGILLFIALICAIVFLANVWFRNFMLPGIAFGLLVLSAILAGGIYPAVIQQFKAKPNVNVLEAPYIARNIAATRAAYDVSYQTVEYPAKTTATSAELRADTGTIPNARLLDPNVLSDTFTQLQQVRPVYGFEQGLDIDRYTIGGKEQDYVVGVRELDSANLTGNQSNWINRHLVYTHGNGFVAAPANQLDNGKPVFVSGALTPTEKKKQAGQATIQVSQPRIYYGELTTDYAIVGEPKGNKTQREFDAPAGSNAKDTGEQINNTYTGSGGVPIGSFARQLAYAIHFREANFVLSGELNSASKVIYVRDPRQRVEQVAPFLQADGDPYPAVVDGKVVWIVDCYTTSDSYPYAQRSTLGDLTTDANTNSGAAAQPKKEVNYIRNSVKATVDAYNGTVTLYQWGPRDPLLETWKKVFPNTIQPESKITPELRAHFRYPEDLFKVQRSMLAYYHVTNPQEFYNGQSFWSVPEDPTVKVSEPQPPYYLLAQFPGQSQPEFQLTTVLNPINKENLQAVVSVSSDGADYGKFKVLQLPNDVAILGPNQVQKQFTSTPDISRDISLFNQQGSKVVFGNLLTLPVSGGLLYVEPLYVQGNGAGSFPQLRKVLLAFGDQVAYADSLAQGLDQLFGAGAGSAVSAGNGPTPSPSPSVSSSASPSPSGSPGPSGSPSPSASPGPGGSAAVTAAVAAINKALGELATAQKNGDFKGIGAAQADLAAAIKQYQAAAKSASPAPSTAPSPAR